MDETNRLLRERFDSIDANELAAMRERHEEESFNLDFKRINPTGELSDDDKGNLRKTISGFANSAGGIILWGVDTKKTEPKKKGEPEDRGRFQSLVPVANGDRVAIRFHELTATATQPAVSGVVHREIKVDGGFIIKTFVPASDGGPHRTSETNGQYYRRDADAFRAMQHHEIADMFGRRVRPKLEFYSSDIRVPTCAYTRPDRNLPERATGEFVVGLRNAGRGIAHFPRLVLESTHGFIAQAPYGLDGNSRTNLKPDVKETHSRIISFSGGADSVIHSGGLMEITKIGFWTTESSKDAIAKIKYSIYAADVAVLEGEFVASPPK